MRLSRLLIVFAFAAIMAAGDACGRAPQPPTPRPEGYPRPFIYPEAMSRLEGAPCVWPVCAGAKASVSLREDGTVWADVAYPAYGATLHITFTEVTPATADATIKARRERMAANLNAAQASARTVEAPGAIAEIITALDACPTPLQFVAEAPGRIISGALTFAGATHLAPDSIHPMVKAVEADVVRAVIALGAQ